MSKNTIRLEAIDPIEIYGAANKNLEALCSYFPELKVVARGCEIILEGKEEDIEKFATKLHQLIERRQHKMNVTRRTCGYLGENFWNVGKTKEIKARVTHL